MFTFPSKIFCRPKIHTYGAVCVHVCTYVYMHVYVCVPVYEREIGEGEFRFLYMLGKYSQ